RLRHGASTRHRDVRHRSREVSGLRIRIRPRPYGDAEIRRAGPPAVLRFGHPLAAPFRLRGARSAHPRRRAQPMKFTLSWLKAPLDTEADAQTIADKLTS